MQNDIAMPIPGGQQLSEYQSRQQNYTSSTRAIAGYSTHLLESRLCNPLHGLQGVTDKHSMFQSDLLHATGKPF